MKPLIIMMRIVIVGCFWSVFFLEGIRVIMLRNWRFDIISYEHWEYAWDLWMSGWVISDAKEWAFVLILVTFIPLWITGWAALSIINWENILLDIFRLPINLLKKIFEKQLVGIMKIKSVATPVKKKLSYKEVRPRGTRPLAEETITKTASTTKAPTNNKNNDSVKAALKKTKKNVGIEETQPKKSGAFEHSLLAMESEDDDFVFNFDAFDVESKPEETEDKKSYKNKDNNKNKDNKDFKQKNKNREENRDNRENRENRDSRDNRDINKDNRDNNKERNNRDKDKNRKNKNEVKAPQGAGNIVDIIKQKGYEIITGTTIKDTLVDFIGVSKKSICVCLLDREPGDWLADEEKFNDEEPLWFSESSHRISPVRKTDIVKKYIEDVLSDSDYNNMKVEAYVIIQLGNIINAEDMLAVWNDMNIFVTRIDRGTPKDIMLFAKSLSEGEEPVSEKDFDNIRKLIRNIK